MYIQFLTKPQHTDTRYTLPVNTSLPLIFLTTIWQLVAGIPACVIHHYHSADMVCGDQSQEPG